MGTLTGDALLHLLPHAMLSGAGNTFFLFLFFLTNHLEKFYVSSDNRQYYHGTYWLYILEAVLRIRNVYPGSRILTFSQVAVLGSQIQHKRQKRSGKKGVVLSFIYSHKFHQILHYFNVWTSTEKNWSQLAKTWSIFYPKLLLISLKYGLGSGIRDPEKTRSWIQIKGSQKHRILDPDPQQCLKA